MNRLKLKFGFKKNVIYGIIFSLLPMRMSYALQEEPNPICKESSIKQFQMEAEKIVQNAKNPYEGQMDALLSLKPIVEFKDCLQLNSTNKNIAPKDLNSAIAYVDVLSQAVSYIIDLKAFSQVLKRDRINYDDSKLTESESIYLNYFLNNDGSGLIGGHSCLSVFESNIMVDFYSMADLPGWLPEDRKAKIKKYLTWCEKVFVSAIDKGLYWVGGVSEIKRFTDQKKCPFAKGATFLDKNLCISFKNYDYDWLREKNTDGDNLLNSLNCSNNPVEVGCPYLEIILREKGKMKKVKFVPDIESALSSDETACGVSSIRVDPKTKQFALFGTFDGNCFGGYNSFEIEEIYEIQQFKPVLIKSNSTRVRSYRNDPELEGLTNGKIQKEMF